MPMENVHKPLVLLLAFLIAFSSLTTPSDGHKANLNNHNAKNGDTGVKQEDHPKIPSNGLTYPGADIGYSQDFHGSMYVPASNGQKGALDYGGYPPNFYGYPPVGYGYPFPFFPFPGGIFGFPRGIFGFPRGILPFPPFRGVPGGYGGSTGGYGGSPGGYGGSPGGYGGSPGGYGGNPGVYGSGGTGNKPGGGYGSKAEMKGKEVDPHD